MISHFGVTIDKATKYLTICGAKGALTCEVAEHLGCTGAHASRAMNMGESRGVFGHHPHPGDGAANRKRWYMAEMRPADPPKSDLTGRRKKNQLTISLPWRSHAKWNPTEPAVCNVKAIVCPSSTDNRYTFKPPRGWVGQITRDWKERRGS